MSIRMTIVGLGPMVDDLRQSLDDHMAAAAIEVANVVGIAARAAHGYQNRTGLLESSTHGDSLNWRGSFLAGSLASYVVADTPYAQYVEAREDLAFLAPAFNVEEEHLNQMLDDAIVQAVRAAGWM